MPRLYDLKDKEFNFLKVIEKCENSIGNQIYWKCKCICGKEINVTTRNLRSGKVKSCGCTKSTALSDKKKTHGMTNTRIFRIWSGMKFRCYIPSSSGYENYGGRGITICPEWLGEHGFENFYNWSMKNGFRAGLTIDRINNDGNYEPPNCRWTDKINQCNNRRSNRFLTARGETHTVAEWSRITGLKSATIIQRLNRGDDGEMALREVRK